jgi:predicted metalloprotease
MRWKAGRRSDNIEDRRSIRIPRKVAGGGIGIIVVALIAMYFGVDPTIFLDQQGPTSSSVSTYTTSNPMTPAETQLADFVSVVLADTEDTWHVLFNKMGKTYDEPKLVLFSGAVESACGFAQAAMGPFYCPTDQKVYIDLTLV